MEEAKKVLLDVIRTRRSVRSYRQDPLPRELLDEIIEAGRLAPSGNNTQSVHFIVLNTPEKMAELRDVVTGVLANTPVREGMPAMFVGLINKAKEGPVEVSYGAPCLVLTANKQGYDNALNDCACALENMMLAASASGLGSCWINIYYRLRQAPAMREYLLKLGMREDEEVCGALVLGYSDHIETTPLPRTGNPVTYT